MAETRSNAIFFVIGAIIVGMLAMAGTFLWIAVSNDAARGYIPREARDAGP